MDNRTQTRKAIDALGGPSQAAKALDVARSYIYDMLNNGASKPRCYQLAALSGVPVNKLLKEAKQKDDPAEGTRSHQPAGHALPQAARRRGG